MNTQLAIHLATCPTGRLLLHLLCLMRRPEHAGWHWAGIRRELRPLPRKINRPLR